MYIRKENKMTPVVPLPWQLSRVQSLLSKTKYGIPMGQSRARNRHGSNIVLTLLIRLLGVDDTWLRKKTGNFTFLIYVIQKL